MTYRANAGLGELSLGRWLGVSHKVGQLMSYWILANTGKVISCTTVQRLTNLEQKTREWISRMDDYDESIKRTIIDVKDIGLPMEDVPRWNQLSQDENDESFTQLYQNVLNNKSIPKEDDIVTKDQYINMEVNINRGDENCMERATVKRRPWS